MNQAHLIKPLITACTILTLLGCTAEEPPPTQAKTPEAAPLSTLRPTATETPKINIDTPTSKSTTAVQPTAVFLTTSTPLPSQTPTLLPTLIPTPELTCPILTEIDSDTQSLIESGSILLQPFGESRVLAISGNEAEPYTINAPLEWPYLVELSPNKTKLLFWRHGETIFIYDLLSMEENQISWQESWPSIRGWSVDDRIKFVLSYEEIEGQGIISETLLLDPTTLNSEVVTQEISLPDFTFQENQPRSGFVSWNPNKTLVVYTATPLNGGGVDFVLRNIITDEELWRYENVNDFIIPMTDWSKDGNRILLGIIPRRPSSNSYPDRVIVASLTIEELMFEVLLEPSFVTNREHFWDVEWSTDTQYMLIEIATPPSESTNHFYILDTNNSTTYQICEPGILDMWWIPEFNQLLYIVQLDDGQALKLLDVDSWQTQNLMQTDEHLNRYTNFIGWTPIEFTN